MLIRNMHPFFVPPQLFEVFSICDRIKHETRTLPTMTTYQADNSPLAQILEQAVTHHRAGQLPQAAQLYRNVLQAQPGQPDANHNLGVIARQEGQHIASLPYFKAALDSDPTKAQYLQSYTEALVATGQLDEAQRILQSGLVKQANAHAANSGRSGASAPPAATDMHLLASLFNAGRHEEAEARTHLLLRQYPDSGFLWKVLAASLLMQGKDALSAASKAVALLPEDAEAHNNLGNVLRENRSLAEAVACYRKALQIDPDMAIAHNNQGIALENLGKFEDATACYRKALQIRPGYAEAYNNLGVSLHHLGRLEESAFSFRQALQIKPDYAEAHVNMGNLLRELGRLPDAATCFHNALHLSPQDKHAHNNLGNVYRDMEQLDSARISYQRAVEVDPGFAEAHSNLGLTLQDLGQIDSAIASYRLALDIDPAAAGIQGNLMFALNYHPDISGEELFAAYRAYDERFGLPLRSTWPAHLNVRDARRRLKVGYVSPDFRMHSCRHFLEPLLAHHDKRAVEVYAYAELAREDQVTSRYKEYADHWVTTRGMSDEALAERIRADGIDILVDLAGHTAQNRLGVFARKPAPVSLSWLGFGYTTGLSAIDYFLSDASCVPQGSEHLFSETPWKLPTPSFAYRPAEGMGEVSPLPAVERGHVTFGTLTRAVRINHRTIRVWSDILKAVPNSRLVIDNRNFKEPAMQDRLAERFAEHGIQRERLEIGYHSPPWDVLRGMDIGLDCFPHNSGTTLFETLYMGVPYVTLADRPSVGRLGSSILEALGHPEWIARDEDEYVATAVALASDISGLSSLRTGLRTKMASSPLMDEPAFARKVEEAYQHMWANR